MGAVGVAAIRRAGEMRYGGYPATHYDFDYALCGLSLAILEDARNLLICGTLRRPTNRYGSVHTLRASQLLLLAFFRRAEPATRNALWLV